MKQKICLPFGITGLATSAIIAATTTALFIASVAETGSNIFLKKCSNTGLTAIIILFVIGMIATALSVFQLIALIILCTKRQNKHVVKEERTEDPTPTNSSKIKTCATVLCSLTTVLTVLVGLVACAAVVAIAITMLHVTRASSEKWNGTIELKNSKLSDKVILQRESSGVTHIAAKNNYDMYFAQGYAHAQDRLFQMVLFRATSTGSVASVAGAVSVQSDKSSRILGFTASAKKDWEHYDADSKEAIQAYVDGINAYIANPEKKLQHEFSFFSIEIVDWTVYDVLACYKQLSLGLASNYLLELVRYQLMTLYGVSFELAGELFGEYSAVEGHPTVLTLEEMGIFNMTQSEIDKVEARHRNDSAAYIPLPTRRSAPMDTKGTLEPAVESKLHQFIKNFQEQYLKPFASNNWGLHKDITKSGQSINVNDPHLVLNTPNIWYLSHLKSETGGIDAIGGGIAGIPGIFIGKGPKVSWGVTNAMMDIQDLYLITPSADGASYLFNGSYVPFNIRQEVIKVRNGEDVTIQVKETVHGPIINDIYLLTGELLAVKWTTIMGNDTSLQSFLKLPQSSDFNSFKKNLEDFVSPPFNFVMTDSEGNLGYIAPGKIPIRKEGHSGSFVVPGDGNWEWDGYAPFDKLPQTYNPSKKFVSSANNRPHPYGYPYNMGRDFAPKGRAKRIEEALEMLKTTTSSKITSQDMQAMLFDTQSDLYKDLKPILQDIKQSAKLPAEYTSELDMLLSWDGVYKLNRQEPLVLEAFWGSFAKMTEPEVVEGWVVSPSVALKLYAKNDIACTKHKAGRSLVDCVDYAAFAFERAVKPLKEKYGTVPVWGTETFGKVTLNHQLFPLQVPLLGCIFSLATYSPGGTDTINVATIFPTQGYSSSHGVSYRHVIEFNEETDAFVIPGGNSGNAFSFHYDNMLSLWTENKYASMKTKAYTAAYTLEIIPK